VTISVRPPHYLPRVGLAAVSGPFRIAPTRILARRELRSSADPSLLLTLEVGWEPRLRPVGLKQNMADVKVLGDNGEPVAVEDPEAVREAFPRRGVAAVEIEVPLLVPRRPIKEIKSLKGTIRAIVPGQIETFKFTDILHAKKVEKRIAGATVTLDEVRKNGDTWEVFMRLRFDDAGDALESHRNWVLQNEAYLEGPDGKPIPCDSSETTRRTNNEIGMGYVFSLDQPPTNLAFVYKTPGTIVTKAFPYELKDLKLP
jgi:hypothetical protein